VYDKIMIENLKKRENMETGEFFHKKFDPSKRPLRSEFRSLLRWINAWRSAMYISHKFAVT